jgi:hypothetical protein
MADTNNANDQSLLWGSAVELWDRVGIWALITGAVLGVAALLVTTASAYILYRVADKAQTELTRETKSSAERIATLNNEAARLQAGNLALQTVLLPRHVGLVGINQDPKAAEWFDAMETFAGTEFIIVFANDSEAHSLAKEIETVLRLHGLTAHVDSNRTIGPTPDSRHGRQNLQTDRGLGGRKRRLHWHRH